MIWYPKVAILPEIIITITLINLLKSFTNNARKVNGMAKVRPSFSGNTEPKIIPRNVVICQIVQQVVPAPNK